MRLALGGSSLLVASLLVVTAGQREQQTPDASDGIADASRRAIAATDARTTDASEPRARTPLALAPLVNASAGEVVVEAVPDLLAAPATEELEAPPVYSGPRAYAIGGLLLDPAADADRLAAWYARTDAADLAQALFRLERLLGAFVDHPGESPVGFLLASDIDTVVREADHVRTRLAGARDAELAQVVATRAKDGEREFALRHARESSEELYVATLRWERALRIEGERLATELDARGDYEVLPESAAFS